MKTWAPGPTASWEQSGHQSPCFLVQLLTTCFRLCTSSTWIVLVFLILFCLREVRASPTSQNTTHMASVY